MALGQDYLPVLQFSPVSIIPPLLHTHSFIYHPRCIMFFSQYFSFPCQYHSTIAPYSFIHLPHMLYNVFLPVLRFPLSVSFHQCSTLIHLIYYRRYIILTTEVSLDNALKTLVDFFTLIIYRNSLWPALLM